MAHARCPQALSWKVWALHLLLPALAIPAFSQSVSVSPSSGNLPSQGGNGGLSVNAAQNVGWNAASSQSWLTITSGTSGSGNGQVQYSALGNPLGIDRTATITVTATGTSNSSTFMLTQSAGTLSLSPNSVNMSAPGGSNSIQTVTPDSALLWTASASAGWLTITSGSSGTGQGSIQFTASANPNGSPRTATIWVTPQGGSAVGASVTQLGGVLVMSPSSANVPGAGGSGSINLSTDDPALQWTASSDQSWLAITSGTSGAGSATVQWTAAANPTMSNRSASIRIFVTGAQAQTFNVNQERGTATRTLVANPSSLSFSHQTLATPPSPTGISVSVSAGSSTQVEATANTASGGNWLSVFGGGSTPTIVTAAVTPGSLQPGNYQGTITLTSNDNSIPPLSVPVTLTVTAAPSISAQPSSLAFSYQQRSVLPFPQTIKIESSGSSVAYDARPSSGAPWLRAVGSGDTPGTVTVSVDPSGLRPGDYSSSVRITAGGAQNNPLIVPVAFKVTSAPNLLVSPASVSFDYVLLGPSPSPVDVAVSSSGGPLNFTARSSAPFIQVSGGGPTPSTIRITCDPSGLFTGHHSAEVTLYSNEADNAPVTIPVNLTVSVAPLLIGLPRQLPFYAQQGTVSTLTKQIAVLSAREIAVQAEASTESGGNWLTVQPAAVTTPAALTAAVTVGNLAPGEYHGVITLTSSRARNSPQRIAVTLTVSLPPPLEVNPTQLAFAQGPGNPPPPQTLTVTTKGGPPATVTASASTITGGNWLLATGGGETPATVQVAVNTLGLAEGHYEGSVSLQAQGYQPVNVPVTLSVSRRSVIATFPKSLTFSQQQNGAAASAQSVAVLTAPRSLVFSSSVSSNTPWLKVIGSGAAPGTIQVSVDGTGMNAGAYSGAVVVQAVDADNSPVSIPVSFAVTPGPVLSALPASLRFSGTVLASRPEAQPLMIESSATPLDFVYSVPSEATWLTVTGQGPTPSLLTVAVSQVGLPAGTYEAPIVITSPTASNSPLTVPVSFEVSQALLLVPSPPALVFAQELGKNPPLSKSLTVTSTGASASVGASVSTTSGGNWLAVSGGGPTPAVFTVSANPAGLTPGRYEGTITLYADQAGNSPLTVPVVLIVAQSPVLSASPDHASFSYQTGQALPSDRQIELTSSGSSLPVQIAVSTQSGGNWLRAVSGSATPTLISIGVDPRGLAPGTYAGSVNVSSSAAGNSPLTVPVSLLVTSAPALAASPSSVTFSYEIGSALPTVRPVQITSTGSQLDFSTSVSPGAPWLSVTGDTKTPGVISIAANPAGLEAGSYSAAVSVLSDSAANNPLQIPVVLTVARAPVLSVSPSSLRFTYRAMGAAPAPQQVQVTSSSGSIAFSTSVSTGAPWLNVSNGGNTPLSVTVSVDPTGLEPGNYAGTVSISSPNAVSVQVPVSLIVTGAASIVVQPEKLNFSYRTGAAFARLRRFLLVGSTAEQIAVTASTETSSQGKWLSVGSGGQTPFQVAVTVDPSGLAPGAYTGEIVLTSPGTLNSPLVVPVTLSVASAAVLDADPDTLTFSYQTGSLTPPAQQFAVSSTIPVPVSVQAATEDGKPWLMARSNGAITPANVTVTVNPLELPPGSYRGTVSIVSPSAANSPLLISVSLTVAGAPMLYASPAAATFAATPAYPGPPPLTVNMTSTGASVTVSGSVSPDTPWLSVSGGGPTPSQLTLQANAAGLAPGIYSGAVLAQAAGAANSPMAIAVTLMVGQASALVTEPSALYFQVPFQGASAARLQVLSTDAPLPFVASSTAASPWVRVGGSGTTPQSVIVGVDAAGMQPGLYQGAVIITSPGVFNSPLTVPVSMFVNSAGRLNISPAEVYFEYTGTETNLLQQMLATVGGLAAPKSQARAAGGPLWLSVASQGNGVFTATADPTTRPVGDYTAAIVFTEPDALDSPKITPVRLHVSAQVLTVLPTSISLAAVAGQSTSTSSTIQITGGPAPFEVLATGSTWLKIQRTSESAPAEVTVTANPTGLRPGTYLGSVDVVSLGLTQTIPVTLSIGAPSASAISPKLLAFRYGVDRAVPLPVTIAFASTRSGTTFEAVSADRRLSVIPAAFGSTATLTVRVNALGLGPGTYRSEIVVRALDQSEEQSIPVELHVGPEYTPAISSVVNAASLLPEALSPGQIISIFGAGMGPSASIQARDKVLLPSSLEGTEVLINGVLSPLLYVSNSQINAVVPYALDTSVRARVVVRYRGLASPAFSVFAGPSSPGIFSQTANGLGPGSILNEDTSLNSAANPASRGTIVSIYCTGEGQTNPPGIDGLLATQGTLPAPRLPVTVLIGGAEAEVTYAGAAPGFTAGSMQINAKIPVNVPSGAAPIQIRIGDRLSQTGLTVAVR